MEFHTLFIETLYDLLCAAVGLNFSVFSVTVRVNHGNSAESFLDLKTVGMRMDIKTEQRRTGMVTPQECGGCGKLITDR